MVSSTLRLPLITSSSLLLLLSSSLPNFADGEIFDTIASCYTVLLTHAFEGDCCALSDLPNGGCQLEVVGGNCNITGPLWNTNITSATRTACPVTAYNALGACKTDLDCPTQFCGSDGECHDYSCDSFFRLSPVMDYDDMTSTQLVCRPMEEDHHIIQYGCVETIGGLVPPVRGIGIKANEVCSGVSKNVFGDESISFQCFQMMVGTNFSDFIDEATALKESGNATCLAPLFYYSSDYAITEFVNGALVQNKIAGDGPPPSVLFNEVRAYKSMFALIAKTPKGGVMDPPTSAPISPGNNNNGGGNPPTSAPDASQNNVQNASSANGLLQSIATLVVATCSTLLIL